MVEYNKNNQKLSNFGITDIVPFRTDAPSRGNYLDITDKCEISPGTSIVPSGINPTDLPKGYDIIENASHLEDPISFKGTPVRKGDMAILNRLFLSARRDVRDFYNPSPDPDEAINRIGIKYGRIVSIDASAIGLKEVKEEIRDLSKLVRLCFFRNKLISLPKSIESLSFLQIINCEGNNLDQDSKQLLERLRGRGVQVYY